MVLAPLRMVFNEDNETNSKKKKKFEEFIKFRHQVQKREFIKAKKKGNPSRRDKALRKHQAISKKRRPSR